MPPGIRYGSAARESGAPFAHGHPLATRNLRRRRPVGSPGNYFTKIRFVSLSERQTRGTPSPSTPYPSSAGPENVERNRVERFDTIPTRGPLRNTDIRRTNTADFDYEHS